MTSRFIPSSLFLLLASVWEHVKFMAFHITSLNYEKNSYKSSDICKLGTSLANLTTSIGKNYETVVFQSFASSRLNHFECCHRSLSIHGNRNAGPEPPPEDMLLGIFQVEQFLRFRFDWKRWSKNTFWRRLCISGLLPKSNESLIFEEQFDDDGKPSSCGFGMAWLFVRESQHFLRRKKGKEQANKIKLQTECIWVSSNDIIIAWQIVWRTSTTTGTTTSAIYGWEILRDRVGPGRQESLKTS